MTEIRVTWNDLTAEEKEQAINSYAAIREYEEQEPCSLDRAKREAPLCKGFYRDETGYIHVDI